MTAAKFKPFMFSVWGFALSNITLYPKSKSKLLYDLQSVSMSWHRVPLWDLRPDIISCRNVTVWNLTSCIWGAPSLARWLVCNLQCNHSIIRVVQNPRPYFTVSSETPSTLCPPGTGWPSYIPGHWVPFTSSLTTRLLLARLRWRYSNPPPTWRVRCLYI
jgi:hypothetical protein